jgi:hypothetical protein
MPPIGSLNEFNTVASAGADEVELAFGCNHWSIKDWFRKAP